jgi:hypothetical protein
MEGLLPEQRLLRKARLWHLESDGALLALLISLILIKTIQVMDFSCTQHGMMNCIFPDISLNV